MGRRRNHFINCHSRRKNSKAILIIVLKYPRYIIGAQKGKRIWISVMQTCMNIKKAVNFYTFSVLTKTNDYMGQLKSVTIGNPIPKTRS